MPLVPAPGGRRRHQSRMIGEPLSCCPNTPRGPRFQVNAITEHHPTFFLAAAVAVLVAVALQMVGLPAPWPPAIAMYVYGAVAWPVMQERAAVKPLLYAAVWVSVALLVIAYERMAVYAACI
jgi:hypothetical protein